MAVYSLSIPRGEVIGIFSLLSHNHYILIKAIIIILKLNDIKIPIYIKYNIENKVNKHLIN